MRRGALILVAGALLAAWAARRGVVAVPDAAAVREAVAPVALEVGARLAAYYGDPAEPTRPSAPPARPPAPPTDTARDFPTAVAAARIDRPLLPGRPRQLLSGGCCVGAWWSADGTRLLYVDRPPGAPAAALWGVALWPPGSAPAVVDARAGVAAGAPRYTARPAGAYSIVRNLDSGEEWPLPTGGNPVLMAPDGLRAVWWDARGGRQDIDALVHIRGADAYGRSPRLLTSLWGATVVGFLPDNRRVLAIGRPIEERPIYAAVTLDVDSGAMVEVANGSWLSDALLSPDGRWIAYLTSLDRRAPERNGVWVAPLDDATRDTPRRMDFVGAYRWRRDGRLLYVPMAEGEGPDTIWEYDAESGATRRLIGPETGLRIAGNEWSVAPDGGSVAWLELTDRNLWVIDLTE